MDQEQTTSPYNTPGALIGVSTKAVAGLSGLADAPPASLNGLLEEQGLLISTVHECLTTLESTLSGLLRPVAQTSGTNSENKERALPETVRRVNEHNQALIAALNRLDYLQYNLNV
jgi:hypothetical protein